MQALPQWAKPDAPAALCHLRAARLGALDRAAVTSVSLIRRAARVATFAPTGRQWRMRAMARRSLTLETLTGTGDLYRGAVCMAPQVDYVIHVPRRDQRHESTGALTREPLAVDGRVSGVLDDRMLVIGVPFELWLEDGRRIACTFTDGVYFRGTHFLG